MRGIDIDLDGGWWTIPPEHSKNGRAHRVPLSTSAVRILKGQLTRQTSGWVFASPLKKGRPLGYPTIYYSIQRVIARSGVKEWGSHDLRRSVATHLASSGVSRLVVSKILNHTEKSVTSIYDRHTYDPDKKMALDAWDRRVQAIIDGKETTASVIPISQGQR